MPVEGFIELFNAGALTGWVWNSDTPQERMLLSVAVEDTDGGCAPRQAVCLANLARNDVRDSGRGDGAYGFCVHLDLEPGAAVTIRDFATGDVLLGPTVPRRVDCAKSRTVDEWDGKVTSFVDTLSGAKIFGWCIDPADPDQPLTVTLTVDGQTVGSRLADEWRGDLAAAGVGTGRHAFTFDLPWWMLDGVEREVHVHADRIGELENSPLRVSAMPTGPAALLEAVAAQLPEKTPDFTLRHVRMLRQYLRQVQTMLPQSLGWAAYPDWRNSLGTLHPDGDAAVPDLLGGDRDLASDVAVRMAGRDGRLLIAALDAGAGLYPGALARALDVIAATGVDVLYGDADCSVDGRLLPWFRPGWSYDLFLAQDYLRGLLLFDARLLEGQPDSMAALKVQVLLGSPARTIRRLPEVLCRLESPFAGDPEPWRRAVAAHLTARGYGEARVTTVDAAAGLRAVTWPAPASPPPVTLIVPTRDRLDLLSVCIGSIERRTSYRPFDILIVDNGSQERETLDWLAAGERQGRFGVMRYDAPFNYADMNNIAARAARGEILGFVNNDVELISPDWLEHAAALLARPEVGAVGARLRFANGMLQHAGVIVGIGGLAENAFQHCHVDDPGYFHRSRVAGNFSAVTAACLFCRRSDFLEVGGFDAVNLPVAFNDVDFCLRLRDRGLSVVWTPQIDLYHFESASRGRDMAPDRRARAFKEEHFMRERWHRVALDDPFYSPNLNLDLRPFTGLALPPRHRWGAPLVPVRPGP